MSEETHDALDLFRSSLAASTPPTLLTAALEPAPTLKEAAYISFSQTSSTEPVNLVKDYTTRFTSKAESKDEFYTVAQIWLAWSERDSGVREYLVKGQAEGVGNVSVADRRLVVDYLNGESDGAGRVVRKGGDKGATALPLSAGVLSAGAEAHAGPSRSAPVKRKYEVNRADLEFCKKLRSEVVELRDRNSVLRASPSGKVHSFESFAKGVMAEKIRALRKSMEAPAGRPAQQPQAVTVTLDPLRGPKKAKSSNPIIMISSSPTALITMWNVRKFLEQGIFEPSEKAREIEKQQGNTRSEDMIPIMRRKTGPNGDIVSKYYVVDGVEALQKFGQDAWDRVICVLTTGQEWQFRPYKWQDPKVLFRHVKGIYLQWSNEPTNPAVRDWNVQELRIDKLKRHTDQQVVANFWRSIESIKRR